MKSTILFGITAASATALAVVTASVFSTTTADKAPAKGKPSIPAATLLVDKMHPYLLERFGNLTDQRFGIEREPQAYHIHDGVVAPELAKKVEAQQQHEERKDFKKFGTDQLPTDAEMKLISDLRQMGFGFEVYTVGRTVYYDKEPYTRFRGPLGTYGLSEDSEDIQKVVTEIAAQAIDPAKPDSVTKQVGAVAFKARAVRINDKSCLSCHKDLKVGDKVGTVVYRYFPIGEVGASSAKTYQFPEVSGS